MRMLPVSYICLLIAVPVLCFGQFLAADPSEPSLDGYNVVWTTPSRNSSESMPVGGGDIGLNVWVENGDVLFYMQRSGTFDENNEFLKLGRVRIRLEPNPFAGGEFRQELKLREGYVAIRGSGPAGLSADLRIWVEVFRPVIHAEIESSRPVSVTARYENWRTEDVELPDEGKGSRFGCFSYDDYQGKVYRYKDTVERVDDAIVFYHRNRGDRLLFDLLVKQQHLESVKDKLWNPQRNRTFGGMMVGDEMVADGETEGRYLLTGYKAWKLKSKAPARQHNIRIYLHTAQTETLREWKDGLLRFAAAREPSPAQARQETLQWWDRFWSRSYLLINADQPDLHDKAWQMGRNYQLFRYMLGCNAYGRFPTKFNGGLFTYDPHLVSENRRFPPDWRAWGGGSFTAQNQRLVYWPMLKSGDFDMMIPQFDFYRRALGNATERVKVYWGHEGACFTEQMEYFGLPIGAAWGWLDGKRRRRPAELEIGVQVNRAVGYHYEAQLEFAFMILQYFRYSGEDISAYLPFIESAVVFFDQHYQYRHQQRTGRKLDENGHLVIYPSRALETYRDATNPVDVVAGLRAVLSAMLALPERYAPAAKKEQWRAMLERVPPLPARGVKGLRVMEPAESYEGPFNVELPQFYPLFPFDLFHLGDRAMPVFVNTWRTGKWTKGQLLHTSWHQNGIFMARMGLVDEAVCYNTLKMEDSGRRFPAFWGPGHDWVPDHNWGGSGMIGLQEMLMQTHDGKIRLLPAWPKEWNCDFRKSAAGKTGPSGGDACFPPEGRDHARG